MPYQIYSDVEARNTNGERMEVDCSLIVSLKWVVGAARELQDNS